MTIPQGSRESGTENDGHSEEKANEQTKEDKENIQRGRQNFEFVSFFL